MEIQNLMLKEIRLQRLPQSCLNLEVIIVSVLRGFQWGQVAFMVIGEIFRPFAAIG